MFDGGLSLRSASKKRLLEQREEEVAGLGAATLASVNCMRTEQDSRSFDPLLAEASFSALMEVLEQQQGDHPPFGRLPIDERLLTLAEFVKHKRKDYRLGALVGTFMVLRPLATEGLLGQIEEETLAHVAREVAGALQRHEM